MAQSSECCTHKTVKALAFSRNSLKFLGLFPFRSEAGRNLTELAVAYAYKYDLGLSFLVIKCHDDVMLPSNPHCQVKIRVGM